MKEKWELWKLNHLNEVIPCEPLEYMLKFNDRKIVQQDFLNDHFISTVFIGMYDNIFETLLDDSVVDHYNTYSEALIGHQKILDEIRKEK